jgi:ATP-dependent protease ClpP protease subunit
MTPHSEIVGKLMVIAPSADAPPAERVRKCFPEIKLRGAIETAGPINLANVRRAVTAIDMRRGFQISIQSGGGNINEALRIYGYLRSLPVPISARVDLFCISSAVLILLGADHRTMSIDDDILIHASRRGRHTLREEFYTAADLREIADRLAASDDECCALLNDRTGYPREWFADNFSNEESMSATEVLDCGLIHEIEGMSPRCAVAWAEQARALKRRGVYVADHYLTPNYRQACAAADRLRGD